MPTGEQCKCTMEEFGQLQGMNRQSTIHQPSCILQCGELCDEATDSISSTERWANIKEKPCYGRILTGLARCMQPLIGIKVLLDNA